ncbi:MAG: DUF2851 family protein, partial [Vicinamibacterales bacterium]
LLDALGLVHNREGMAAVAERVPLAACEQAARQPGGATALLLGAGGFLPLSPAHAALADLDGDTATAIERRFELAASRFDVSPVPATIWSLNRVRPVNHPVRRLASLGALIDSSSADGLLGTTLALPLDAGRSWQGWLESVRPAIGRSRSRQIAVNALAPFLAAYADATGDVRLADEIGQLWETLAGVVDDSVAKATLRQIVGERRFPIRLAIESQGLHQIGRHGCRQLRCFECPIAALAVMHEAEHAPAGTELG